jgi:V/A-type H+-transporting ATPase subunit I
MSIAKMSRVFLVGPSIHKEETVRFLQRAGVVHLEPVQPLTGHNEKEASAALMRLRRLGQIEEAVNRYRHHEKNTLVLCPDEELVRYAEDALAALQETENRRHALQRLADDLAPWGDFDPDVLHRLEEAGVYVRRWRMDRKKGAELNIPDGIYAEIILEKPGILFYTISLAGLVDIPVASPLPMPEMGLAKAQREIERLKTEEESLACRLAGIALRADVLKAQVTSALNEALYLEQMGTLYAEDYLFGLQGWIPDDHIHDFLRKIEKEHLPLQCEVRDSLPEEEPPILLKNNWLIRRIEPLLKLYGIPKYRDLDPAYFFAPFMILFFGLCLSDAGYGVVFYLVAHFIGRKWGGKVEGLPLAIKLCKAFAVSAVIIGLITGSVFGYNFEDRRWILLDVAPGIGNPMLYFYIALGLGVVHLSLSYLMGMAQAVDRYSLLQKLGILFVLWGGVMMIIRNIWFPAPDAAWIFNGGVGVLALGILLTLLFASDHPNWFIRLGIGLWNVYGLSGLIGDLLSYARLFGLGIATGAIAAVMNQLALMIINAAGPIIGIPLALIVIVLGHTFNLALSILGSTIHSARLHFVEAFKSFFEGGGVEYKPFKIERGKL